jgi:LacI family transcriptional regulator
MMDDSKYEKKFNVTMEDVAKKAGVSRSTVSRVLSNYPFVNQQKKNRVLAAIHELSYHPNIIAQSLVKQQTKTIALVVPDIANPFYSEVARGIEEIASKEEYSVVFGSTNGNPAREEKLLSVLIGRQVDGVILSTCGVNVTNFPNIVSRRIPLVLVARKSPFITTDFVGCDNVGGARQVTEHLFDQGYTKIATICVPLTYSTGEERYQGYVDALRNKGVEIKPDYVFIGDNSIETGYSLMEQLISRKPRPDAVFIANNMTAAGALNYCKDHNIKIPEDLAIATFDSFGYLDNLIRPSLTTNQISLYDMGQTTMDLLLKRIRNPQVIGNYHEIRLKPVLMVRESTKSTL